MRSNLPLAAATTALLATLTAAIPLQTKTILLLYLLPLRQRHWPQHLPRCLSRLPNPQLRQHYTPTPPFPLLFILTQPT